MGSFNKSKEETRQCGQLNENGFRAAFQLDLPKSE